MNLFLIATFLNGAGAITLLALMLCAYSTAKVYRPEIRNWRDWAADMALAAAAAAFVFASTNIDFKVLSDETNLLSVANMLTQVGKASNTEMWVYYYRTFHPLDVAVPTRPILFPLLTAIVHAFNGMRWWSPFVVNFFCLIGLNFLTLRWARRLSPRVFPRWLAILALCMSPVLAINATSGGFDLCSVLFGFLSGILLERHWRDGKEDSERALFFTLVCFASVRYESILAIPMVGLALLWKHRGQKIPYGLYSICLFLMVPLFLQRYLTWGSFENPPGVEPFSPMHFVHHFMPFVQAFFLEPRGPYPILVHWLGLFGLISCARSLKGPGLVAVGYGFFLFFLLLCHHFGFAGHPTQARLFLPITFGLTLLALQFLSDQEAGLDGSALLAVFALLVFHHHQYAVADPLSSQLTMTREMHDIRDFMDHTWQEGDLYVYDRPGQLAALGKSAISINHFKVNERGFFENLQKGLYQRIFLIDRPKYADHEPLQQPGFHLVPMVVHQMTPDDGLRISRIDPDLTPMNPPKPAPDGSMPPAPAAGATKPRS